MIIDLLTCHSNIVTARPDDAADPGRPTNMVAPILVAKVEKPICREIKQLIYTFVCKGM